MQVFSFQVKNKNKLKGKSGLILTSNHTLTIIK